MISLGKVLSPKSVTTFPKPVKKNYICSGVSDIPMLHTYRHFVIIRVQNNKMGLKMGQIK